jgi:hypothetical protein
MTLSCVGDEGGGKVKSITQNSTLIDS